MTELAALKEAVEACRRCHLRDGARNVVFGEGNPHARVMLIGEGPGRQEDLQGRPFVGAAGQLLDKIIAACGWQRSEVYIANIVKCRPPNNRVPTIQEAQTCMAWLDQQIRLIAPELIIALGSTAARHLINPNFRITRSRGHWFEYKGIPVMPTFHPAALLRDPSKKRPVWEDFKQVIAFLEQDEACSR
ncbi:MAG: uracil-DNA glycosylase [Firmicutes bacterium]|nr:uracil-DNA glycosylase [Bacillota bacterium]